MTTADAYDVRPFLVDDSAVEWPKLVTTGLIDPSTCLWGERRCRYLNRDLDHPRIDPSQPLTPSLRRRVEKSRRPKVLVAGLSKRIECFVDRAGEYVGAVSTYSIYHRDDNVAQLEHLCHELLTEAATERFIDELGGTALGGGNTTMTRAFLQTMIR